MTELLKLKDGDGGDEGNTLSEVHIEVLDNGYVLTLGYDEGETKEAYIDKSELLRRLGDVL